MSAHIQSLQEIRVGGHLRILPAKDRMVKDLAFFFVEV
jgi:hypothetical protein